MTEMSRIHEVMYFMSCLSAPLKNSWEYLPMHIVNLWSAVTQTRGLRGSKQSAA